MLGLNLGGCSAGTGADVQMLLWGWYLLAEGWGQPRAKASCTPASGPAKAHAPKSCSASLQGNPSVFFHCRLCTACAEVPLLTVGSVTKICKDRKESFASSYTASTTPASVLLQQPLGTVSKLQEVPRLLGTSSRSLSSLIFHKS